ncbi:MAG: penicillin-binding transpeptidase domain-containing protein, partial [Coriobacteriia bacterium]|nr:penicillin-binding transpeptidase domain-containing protein [Coriobacteriia bacterium]
MMQPHLVSHVTSTEGFLVWTNPPVSMGRVMSVGTAEQMQVAMKGVVDQGTGTAARIYGYDIYGKTGTAQTSNAVEDSWFIGWIEINGESYVVAMVLEQRPTGTSAEEVRSVFQSLIRAYVQ